MKCRVCGKLNDDVPYNHCCWPCRLQSMHELPAFSAHVRESQLLARRLTPVASNFQLHLSTYIVLTLLAGAWFLATLALYDFLKTNLWRDGDSTIPFAMGNSGLTFICVSHFALLGFFALKATMKSLEGRIARREGLRSPLLSGDGLGERS